MWSMELLATVPAWLFDWHGDRFPCELRLFDDNRRFAYSLLVDEVSRDAGYPKELIVYRKKGFDGLMVSFDLKSCGVSREDAEAIAEIARGRFVRVYVERSANEGVRQDNRLL